MNNASLIEVLKYILNNHFSFGEKSNITREDLMAMLQKHGFSKKTLDQAFIWLRDLMKQQTFLLQETSPTENAIRVFAPKEIDKLSFDCRSTILTLEKLKILDANTREIVIHQLMQLNEKHVDLLELRWVTTIVLLSTKDQTNVGGKLGTLSLLLPTTKYEC